MPYSRAFFELQVRFAQALAVRFGLPLHEALWEYTTFPLHLGQESEWQAYVEGLAQAADPAGWTYECYLPRAGADLTPQDTHFHGQPLFGPFYYQVRDGHIIRPHIVKIGTEGVLSRDQQTRRLGELARMFLYIRENEPDADEVRGNSWLYNLEAYRRLFPPAYTAEMAVSDEGEFRYLARWGQFFDRYWQVKEPLAEELLCRVAALDNLTDLKDCFPYPILQPRCKIGTFCAFYGSVSEGPGGTEEDFKF